jgi:hypothetical protein
VGQFTKQVVRYKLVPLMQVRHDIGDPEHVAHGEVQEMQDDPETTVTPVGHESTQDFPERKNVGKQVSQLVTRLEQVAQLEVHSWHTFPEEEVRV